MKLRSVAAMWSAGLCAWLGGTGAAEPAADGGPVFDVPRLEQVVVDGDAADWADAGFRIDLLNPSEADRKAGRRVDAQVRLGWDATGLLVCVDAVDRTLIEAEQDGQIWRGDSVELFVADAQGGRQLVQLMLAPGRDARFAGPRMHGVDSRADAALKAASPVEAQYAAKPTDAGYVLEAKVPWRLVGVSAESGREAGFQIYVNDGLSEGEKARGQWYPTGETHRNSKLMHRIRLADEPSPAAQVTAWADWERLRRLRVDVLALPEHAGEAVTLVRDGEHLATGLLEIRDGRAQARLRVAAPVHGTWEGVEVLFADGAALPLALPDLADARAMVMHWAGVQFRNHVFDGPAFPGFAMAQPNLVEDAIGPYEMEVAWYDASGQPVKQAEKPGRYGAVVTLRAEDGRTFTRYRTLYRSPEAWKPWESPITGEVQLPTELGVSEAVAVRRMEEDITSMLMWSLWGTLELHDGNARMLAGLHELSQRGEPVTTGAYAGPWTMDRQWWVDFKRAHNGNAARYPSPFAGPKPASAGAGRGLRSGTMSEAGMAEDAPERIDAVLQAWAAESDEAFVACVVRHGVVVLHQAYGTRDGEPMTTQTPSYMASLSKLISGTCLMMLVDEGRLDLDEPIDTYLPELRGAAFNTMPTLRHLYTHTAGMTSHRGEDEHDLEHLIAELAPQLKIGERFEYNGMSLELGMKILEQVTGQAYPHFVKQHLLDPLGCEHTEALNASWNTASTAMDMARIGQMLLDGGADPQHRYMAQQTRDAMLPQPLTITLGPDTQAVRGIGTEWFEHDGLSARCFGHGAASSATLRIDLEQDLVIAMTRNKAGRNFKPNHAKFVQTVTDCLVDEQTKPIP